MTTEVATEESTMDSTVERPNRGRRLARLLVAEPVIVTVVAAALAVLMTWPTMAHPMSTVPQDNGDPMMVVWLLTWPGHILTTDPANFWNANSFYPDADSYFFSDRSEERRVGKEC